MDHYFQNSAFRVTMLVFLFFLLTSPSQAATFSSQCSAGEVNLNCSHSQDSQILSEQCAKQFSGTTCLTMDSYLSALEKSCKSKGTSGTNCDLINQNGAYGEVAASYASSLGSSSGTSGGTGSGGGSGDTYGHLTLDCADGMLCIPPDGWAGMSGKDIKVIVTSVLKWMLQIIGMIAIISFAISGFQYFMATGDEREMEKAKRNLNYSIIGILAALSGYVIVQAVDAVLNASTVF